MMTSIVLLCVIMICYFAMRVNRIEARMNVLENILRQLAEGKNIDTEYLGKPFQGATGLRDVLISAWRGKE